MSNVPINIVWFKRDLRLIDHEPLGAAAAERLPVLLLYIFEPSVMAADDSDIRHWRFAQESLNEMQNTLLQHHGSLWISHLEALQVFELLSSSYLIHTVFSHEETGNALTFARDKQLKSWFKKHGISWKEFAGNGVVRGLKNRQHWKQIWDHEMNKPISTTHLSKLNFVNPDQTMLHRLQERPLPSELFKPNHSFQRGGAHYAQRYLEGFLETRHLNYSRHISKPLQSRTGCSRLSPYLSYGNLSLRMVYQQTIKQYGQTTSKRDLTNFISRLHWRSHFMQKFESESRYEFENVNSAFDALVKPMNERFISSYENGQTGIPIIDAGIRCLIATGYVNFRTRAMLVSFFVFNLWQDWRHLHCLARTFLDYEPGIHFPQLQMQSGTTGINTLRIYNPIKNALAHDPEAKFVKEWVPELQGIPADLAHQPHLLSAFVQQLYGCEIGKHYPEPIVDIEVTGRKAREVMWRFRKQDAVKAEGQRILSTHVNQHASFIQKKKSVKQIKLL